MVEFAWRIPRHSLIRDGLSKWPLRRVLYHHVPRELIERPKTGFGIPLGEWLRGTLRDWAETLLAEKRLREWFGARYKNADMAPRVSIWGGVAEVVDKLGELVRAGAQHFLLNPVFDDAEHLEKLASEVMPRL